MTVNMFFTLMKALRYHGLDVFPELDSYAYVDGILLKHIATEEHLYQYDQAAFPVDKGC